MLKRITILVALLIVLVPAGALASPWSLKIADIDGSQGVTTLYTFSPDLLVITLTDGHTNKEFARRLLTAADNAIVAEAVRRFAEAGLPPMSENPVVSDGTQISVDFSIPGGRAGSVTTRNVYLPDLETLVRSIKPLLPEFPASMLSLARLDGWRPHEIEPH